RARFYDPSTGRFLSQDPLSFAAGDTNLYRYVGNSPTNATDPTGHIAIVKFLVGAMLGSSVGFATGYFTGAWCEYWTQWSTLAVQDQTAQRQDWTTLLRFGEIKWDKVHAAGLQSARTAAAYGALFGGSFALLALAAPTVVVPAGATLGLYGSWKSVLSKQLEFNEAWKRRETQPELLFGTMMCVFGDVTIGEITGPLVTAVATKGIGQLNLKQIDDAINRFLLDDAGTLRVPIDGAGASLPITGFTIVDGGIPLRKVSVRPSNPLDPKSNWGLRPGHLNKHFFGNSKYALSQIDPGGTSDQWSQNFAKLFSMPETSRTSNGMIDIIGEFARADGSGTYAMGVRLFEAPDGTFDLVTVLTKQ
ncbi:MAG: RHS repeat-associated core domain-containing protein, partial [Planctomycetaceae bacterium]